MDIPDGATLIVGSPDRLEKMARAFVEALRGLGKGPEEKPPRDLFKEFWPIVVYLVSTILLLLLVWLSHLLSMNGRSVSWLLTFWISGATSVVTLLPMGFKVLLGTHNSLRVALEVCSFGLTLAIFSKSVLHLPFLHLWTLCAVLLILLLSIGGRSIEAVHDSIGTRLAKEWDQSPNTASTNHVDNELVKSHLALLQRHFKGELVIFSALPFGTLVGLFLSWVLDVDFSNRQAVVSTCLRTIFGIAGMVLMWFLYSSSIRMSDPILRLPALRHHDLETKEPSARDWGCILTDYRKMFFFDAILNTMLLLAFGLFEWFLWGLKGISVGDSKFFATVLTTSILLNEIPYLVGQMRVQELLVRQYKGWERSEKTKEVGENIPLVPKFEFVAALIGEASAGGLALGIVKQISELMTKSS